MGGGRGKEFGRIETAESVYLQQFGVGGSKGVEPGSLAVVLKGVPHKEQPGLGDRFVILHVRTLAGRKVPERFRHALGGRREGKPPQIYPRRADVVNVVKIRERRGFKRRQEFVVRKW